MGMYSMFETDGSLEKNGIVLDYGDFRITISRAGGSNKRFSKALEHKTKPYRRAIQTDTMDPILAERLLIEVYAEVVVLNWQVKVNKSVEEIKKSKIDESKEEWKVGIEAPDGSILPFCNKNILDTFVKLGDLFKDVQEQANKVSSFRKDVVEADSKN